MRTRDHFAAAALQGICSAWPVGVSFGQYAEKIAADAAALADALARELCKNGHDYGGGPEGPLMCERCGFERGSDR